MIHLGATLIDYCMPIDWVTTDKKINDNIQMGGALAQHVLEAGAIVSIACCNLLFTIIFLLLGSILYIFLSKLADRKIE